MTQNKSIFSILIIMALSTCTILLFGKNKVTNDYEIKSLDRSNTQQVDQVRQLFASSPMQSMNRFDSPDLEKWISNKAYDFLLTINKDNSICGCAIYFMFEHHKLHLQIIAISTNCKWQDIATQLLQQLEQIPNKTTISIYIFQENSAFYKFFKKLGYMQTNEYLTLYKKVNKDSLSSNIHNSICSIRFLDRQNSEEIKLFSEIFHTDEVGGAWTPKEMQKFTTRTSYQFLVAFDTNSQPCAGLIYKTSSATSWRIYVFAVDKNYRRQGIATAMLQTIAQLALKNNIEELIVHTLPINHAGIACYKKQGFREQEIFYEMKKETVTC